MRPTAGPRERVLERGPKVDCETISTLLNFQCLCLKIRPLVYVLILLRRLFNVFSMFFFTVKPVVKFVPIC